MQIKLIDNNIIGRLLLETGRIRKEDYADSLRIAKERGKPLHEVMIMDGKISVDDLVQAITIHVDITLLKEALGLGRSSLSDNTAPRPVGSHLEQISMLFKTGILMSNETNMSSLLDLLIREAPSVMNAERATIFLADSQAGELYSHVGLGLRGHQIRIPWDTGIAGWVFTNKKSLNIADPYNDPRFNKHVDSKTGFLTKNLLCVPLKNPVGTIIGVFQVLNKRAGVFTAMDEEILEILASQAARSIENALEWDHLRQKASELSQENVGLKQALQFRDPLEEIVGTSTAIQEVRSLIRKVAPTETTVLVQGESGTGKELVARAIHRLSRRAKQCMISLNCATVPSELIESELFGYKKGAFTGAISDHKGVFRATDSGTLFLDEIEATSPAMQVKLLRAIQVGEIKPVGDNIVQNVNVRLIAATNHDLQSMIQQGLFREDLFYRINVFPIVIPPLRERTEDIPILAKSILEKLCHQTGKMVRGIDPAVLDLLMRYPWPGNVRELENEIERAHIITNEGGSISVRCLSQRITRSLEIIVKEQVSAGKPVKLKDAVESLEQSMIAAALETCGGNRTSAAKLLGLSRQGLINKIGKYKSADI
jgi:Nif-specific regulatory protein